MVVIARFLAASDKPHRLTCNRRHFFSASSNGRHFFLEPSRVSYQYLLPICQHCHFLRFHVPVIDSEHFVPGWAGISTRRSTDGRSPRSETCRSPRLLPRAPPPPLRRPRASVVTPSGGHVVAVTRCRRRHVTRMTPAAVCRKGPTRDCDGRVGEAALWHE